jgi:hypothetical protein
VMLAAVLFARQGLAGLFRRGGGKP